MKKILSIVLAVCLIITVCPFGMFSITANAETSGYYTYTVSNGKATITDCDTSISGAVTIPSTLGGYPVTSIGDYAFYYCTSLTSITIPDSVTSIDDYAFYNCSSLTSITIPDSVTSIRLYAFEYCTSLTSITIPDSVTSIGGCAFHNTSYYNNTNNWENDALYIGKHLIDVNTNITGAYNIKPGTKTIANEAFYNCSSLTSITIPDSVTSIGSYAFHNCSSLTSITIPDSVTSIGYMAFYNCSSLTNITIPDSVTSIGNRTFFQCRSLTSITIPNSVTSIGSYAFFDCRSLTSITIPDSVTSIGEYAFYGCSSLTTVYYCGTKEQWNKISIRSGNEDLINATRYYHKSGNWQTIVEPTCTTEGEKHSICPNCLEKITKKVIPALGHDYSAEYTIDKEPTDFEEGSKSRHCSRCDSVIDVTVIPKTATDYGICGDNAKWIVRTNGTLIITGNGAIDNYKLPTSAPWKDYSNEITKIIISKEITKIGNNNFGNFTTLKEVEIENPNCEFGQWVFPDDVNNITIYSLGGSSVEEYAKQYGITLIKPENPNKPIAPVLKYKTENLIELARVEGYEYSIGGTSWQSEPIFENLVSGNTYTLYQRIAEDVYAPSEKSEALTVITLVKAQPPIIEAVNKNTITIKLQEGYEYSIDGANWQTRNIFSQLPYDTLICVYQRKMASGTDGATSASEPTKCIIASAPRVLVGKSSIKVIAKPNYEYCIDDMVWQDSNVFTKYIITNETYTVYQRPKAQNGVEIFYDTNGLAVCVNGEDSINSPNSTHLVELRKALLVSDNIYNLAMDFNNDGEVNVKDLVRLKKILASKD